MYETSSFSRKESPLESKDSNTLIINHDMEVSWVLLLVLIDLALINASIQLKLGQRLNKSHTANLSYAFNTAGMECSRSFLDS